MIKSKRNFTLYRNLISHHCHHPPKRKEETRGVRGKRILPYVEIDTKMIIINLSAIDEQAEVNVTF
jgi:hypothetical protein